ncbi:hypothetical protein ACP70R_005769 [Stipagrostis hirtigluma subsp. patula]
MDRRDRSRKATSEAASMAALAAAAAAGEGADGALPPSGEQDKKPVNPVPVAGASSSSSASAPRRGAGGAGAAVAAGGGSGGGQSCQVERCGADLSDVKRYYRRHKVCEVHFKAPVVLVAGLRQRFCQQCSRFHELSEFDEQKRSCRRRLVGHNERRRKSSADARGGGGGGSGSGGDGCRHADQDGRSNPGNPPMNHFQIR